MFTTVSRLNTGCNLVREMITTVNFNKKQSVVPPSLEVCSVFLGASKHTPRPHPGREVNLNNASLLNIAFHPSVTILNLRILPTNLSNC